MDRFVEGYSVKFDLIVFDCDGVLVDSEPIVNRLFVEMLAETGLKLDYEGTLREFSGSSMSDRLQVMHQRFGWEAPDGFVSLFDARLGKVIRNELEPVPGVAEVLSELTTPRCVASNGTRQDMRVRLQAAGLYRSLKASMFSASEVSQGKPAPDLFIYAAERMGVPPSQCAVIEDSLVGVHAGTRAGMTVFGYARLTFRKALEQAGARVFGSMAELPSLLES